MVRFENDMHNESPLDVKSVGDRCLSSTDVPESNSIVFGCTKSCRTIPRLRRDQEALPLGLDPMEINYLLCGFLGLSLTHICYLYVFIDISKVQYFLCHFLAVLMYL